MRSSNLHPSRMQPVRQRLSWVTWECLSLSSPVAHAAREAAATGSVVGMPLTEFGCVQPSMPNSPTSVFEPQPLRYSPRAVQQSAPVAHAAREAAAIVGDVGVSSLSSDACSLQ